MAKLLSGTRIYGVANVDTSVYVGTSNTTTGTGGILANNTTMYIGNTTTYSYLTNAGLIGGSGAVTINSSGVQTTGYLQQTSSFYTDSTSVQITNKLAANGSYGTWGFILASGGSTGAPYWRDTVRVNNQASASTVTIDSNTYDMYIFSALATGLIFSASSLGVNGRKILIRIKDDGTARSLTWTSGTNGFRSIGLTLPTTTVVGKTIYVGLVYNAEDQVWDAIAYTIQA